MMKCNEALNVYPSGTSVYSPPGRITFITTANDTTQADFRPRETPLHNHPGNSNDRASAKGKSPRTGGSQSAANGAPSGMSTVSTTTATLPSDVGGKLVNTFEVAEDCSKHVLVTDFGGTPQTAWPYRLAQADVFV
ncbi:hypothetical protein CDEST_02927 [Colletotrichum destructivum]|uniref:Uncharacterized protein n=1 Tax=Colletotrichum destructivum TaxID=34406 RepID=A0AAX4I3C9_9PEZI|nr:hypothetical protein CDEST_02927 [Colletotrichum destructivum]